MSQKEDIMAINHMAKTVCSKAKEHGNKNAPPAREQKIGTNSGLKFTSKKKTTAVKSFSFDSQPQISKELPSTTVHKSVVKQKGNPTNTTMKCIEITKEFRSSSKTESFSVERRRHKSPSPIKNNARDKTPTKNYSRTTKLQIEHPKSPNSPAARPRALGALLKPTISSQLKTKILVPLSSPDAKTPNGNESNAPNAEKSIPKDTKPEPDTSIPTRSHGDYLKPTLSSAKKVKPHMHFLSSPEKPSAKGCDSSNAASPQSAKSKDSKPRSGASVVRKSMPKISLIEESKMHHSSGFESKTEVELVRTENSESLTLNGIGANSESGSSTGFESGPPNGIFHECEHSESTITESITSKNASKIPRKKLGVHAGLKFHAVSKKETIPQPFSFENRCMKKEIIHSEMNQMKITNMVNN